MMHIRSGLVGPKSGNVEKVKVLKAFLKESKGARTSQECKQLAENVVFGGKSEEKPSKKKKKKYLQMKCKQKK